MNAIENVSGLPLFSQIDTQDIVPTIKKAIENCKAVIEDVVENGQVTYAQVVERIEDTDDVLSKMWSPIGHMNSVVSSDKLREAHDACLPCYLNLVHGLAKTKRYSVCISNFVTVKSLLH